MNEIAKGLRLGGSLAASADKLLGARLTWYEAKARAYTQMPQSGKDGFVRVNLEIDRSFVMRRGPG